MTSTIKVNTIQNTCGADIIKESSNTITIGASGDTVTLASGASQSGFGRTGTVDWQTGDIKTSTFTAENGKGYFCDTNSGGFEVDLPAGSAGAIVSIQDYRNTFDDNNLTIDPNGSEKINGGAAGATVILRTEGLGITFVYIDSTIGWRSVHSNEYSTAGQVPAFIAATGGTVTTVCTNFKVHTFTSPGTFCVSNAGNSSGSNTISYMVVAAGGGGGGANRPNGNYASGAGGGAGGFREGKSTFCTFTASPLATTGLPVTATGFPITIGAGGANAPASGETPASSGSNTIFSTITSAGGGGASSHNSSTSGRPGGSGGGGSYSTVSAGTVGGCGNTPAVSPPQGRNGGNGVVSACAGTCGYNGGGGGGATAVGGNTVKVKGGDGGAGATTNINGSPNAFAGGGGGGVYKCTGCTGASGSGAGGTGGGGPGGPAAGSTATGNGQNGTANTGGGAGGGSTGNNGGTGPATGGTGGSGVVIIRYKFQ